MNIIDSLAQQVQLKQNECALTSPTDGVFFKANHSLSYLDLDYYSSVTASYFSSLGLQKGDKVLVFLKPSLEFIITVFSLFKLGVVVVFIDPGMGIKNLLTCVKKLKPEGFIGIPKAFALRLIRLKTFSSLKLSVLVSKYIIPGVKNLKKVFITKSYKPLNKKMTINGYDKAAIVFTSGATGVPKGVVYTHQMFFSQIKILKNSFSLSSNDIDCSCFPLFSLLNVVLGIKTIIPDMDPRHPAKVDPKKIVDVIKKHNVTFASGSPVIWEIVGNYLKKKDIKLDSIKHLVMFGAPVGHQLHKLFNEYLPNGSTYTPYGATESLPISNISGKLIQSYNPNDTNNGLGTCVGKVVEKTKIKVILDNSPYSPSLSEYKFCKPYEIGEFIVAGEQITHQYYNMEKETSQSKIKDEQGTIWHRMGDVGYLDNKNYIWFCGRKEHIVRTNKDKLYPAQEVIFNQHSEIKKTALISIKVNSEIKAALVVERCDNKISLAKKHRDDFLKDLLNLASSHEITKQITTFFLYKKLPVDPRHNIKIDRIFLRKHFFLRHREAL